MPDYGRDLDIGYPRDEAKPVTVVVSGLADAINTLESAMAEQQKKTEQALSLILGQEIEV